MPDILPRDSGVPLKDRVSFHLTVNHYPPVHESWVEPALIAIEAGKEYLKEGDQLKLYEFVDRGRTKTVEEVLSNLHLWPFVEEGIGND